MIEVVRIHSREAALDAAMYELNRDPTMSMAQLARAIHVGRATLHRHFASRDALLHEIIERNVLRWEKCHEDAGVNAACDSDSPEVVALSICVLITKYLADPYDLDLALAHQLLNRYPALRAREREVASGERRLFQAAQHLRLLRADVPVSWWSSVLWGLMGAVRDGRRVGKVPNSTLPPLVMTTFLSGAANPDTSGVWREPLRVVNALSNAEERAAKNASTG